jgi:nucleotide-binding universal stress UspA family protein
VSTIIALLDQSALDRCTLSYAERLAGANGRLLLIRAIPDHSLLGEARDQARAAEAHHYLHRLVAGVSSTRRVSTHVLYGDESDAILEELFEHKADLVVMTIPAGHGFGGTATGSLAEHVLARSRVPVCVVRPVPGGFAAPSLRVSPRVFVPLNGSSFAEAVLPEAMELARVLGGEVVLLRVVPLLDSLPPPGVVAWDVSVLDTLQADAGPYLRDVAERCADEYPHITRATVRVGVPADSILAVIGQEQVDVVMMATHAHSRWYRCLLGSVTDRVLRGSTVPVVLLRPHALSAPEPGFELLDLALGESVRVGP